MAFPILVGGIAVQKDFLPSVLFATVHGLLMLVFIYRMLRKHSRTWVTFGFLAFAIERTILFSLRSAVAHNPGTESQGLTAYMQATFAVCFIAMLQDLARILRSMLVKATYPLEPEPNQPVGKDAYSDEYVLDSRKEDQPKLRSLFRRTDVAMTLAFIAAIVLGSVGSEAIISNASKRSMYQKLKYASAMLVIVLDVWMIFIFSLRRNKLPMVSFKAASLFLSLNFLLLIPPVYRLIVMGQTTDDYQDVGPGSVNTSKAKALFYVFHVLPETLACITMASVNVLQVFQTGPGGDTSHTTCRKPKDAEKVECNSKL